MVYALFYFPSTENDVRGGLLIFFPLGLFTLFLDFTLQTEWSHFDLFPQETQNDRSIPS